MILRTQLSNFDFIKIKFTCRIRNHLVIIQLLYSPKPENAIYTLYTYE